MSVFASAHALETRLGGGFSDSLAFEDSVGAYVRRLLYIRDDSTIRARVAERFGRRVPLAFVARIRGEAQQADALDEWRDEAAEPVRGAPLDRKGFPLAWRPAPIGGHVSAKEREARRAEGLAMAAGQAAMADAASAPAERVMVWSETVRGIAALFGLTLEDMTGRDRRRMVTRVRFLAMAVLVARGSSRAQVANWFRRDHSTVIYGVTTVARWAQDDPALAEAFRLWAGEGQSLDALERRERGA